MYLMAFSLFERRLAERIFREYCVGRNLRYRKSAFEYSFRIRARNVFLLETSSPVSIESEWREVARFSLHRGDKEWKVYFQPDGIHWVLDRRIPPNRDLTLSLKYFKPIGNKSPLRETKG